MGSRKPDFHDLEARREASIPRLVFALDMFAREYIVNAIQQRGHDRVSLGHGVLLRNMDLEGSPLSVVAQRAGISRQAIAKTAAELAELGYVKTVTSPEDARVKIVKLTKRGVTLVTDVIEIYEEIEAALREVIGRSKLETMRSTLRKLGRELEAE